MRLLVSITSYHIDKKNYVQILLNEYCRIAKEGGIEIHILLYQNYTWDFDFGILKSLSPKPSEYTGENFTWSGRKDIVTLYPNYDYVIASDDDILITQTNIDYYFKHEDIIPHNCIGGFMVMEKDKTGVPYIQNLHTKYPPFFEEEKVINGTRFLIPFNLYSACFMIDRTRLNNIVKQLNTSPISLKRYDVQCTSLCDVYFHFSKLIALNDNGCLVHHLPNKYLSLDNEMFPRNGYQSVQQWRNEFLKPI